MVQLSSSIKQYFLVTVVSSLYPAKKHLPETAASHTANSAKITKEVLKNTYLSAK